MNAQKTAVLIDSGCDVPAAVRKELDIRILPLRIIYPEKDYRDGIDIDPAEVYRRYPEFPSTSTPSVTEVQDAFREIRDEGFEHLIAVCISSELSGTYNTMRLAASEMENLDIFVFNTKNISIGSGIFAVWAAKKLQEGWPFEKITAQMQERIHCSKDFFYMDTLTYLKKGGRIGTVLGTVGEILQIRPIISCNDDGVYYTVAKIRGSRFAKDRLLESVKAFCAGHRSWIVVEEGGAHEEAAAMQEMIRKEVPDAQILFEQQITATLALNTGPGLVGVMAFIDPD